MCAFRNYTRTRGFRGPKEGADWLSPKKPYYFKDDVAYTEDHILVKKLFMLSVTPTLTPKQIKSHFNTFGKVNHLHVFGLDKKTVKTGYVIFSDPRSAAKALKRKVHYVNKGRVTVQPSDSWHQPDAYGPPQHEPLEVNPSGAVASILNLNDHCLEYIVRLLSSSDRVHFARTCERFRSIYQQVSPVLDKSVVFEEFVEMTLWDVRDFFTLSGSNIKQIEGTVPQRHLKRMFDLVGAHCSKLTTMHITACKLSVTNVQRMFKTPKPVEDLQLRGCDLRNAALLPLKNLKHLKKLDLSNNPMLTGQNMDYLSTSIESLTLTNCTGLHTKNFLKICKALPQLKELDLRGIHTIGAGFSQLVHSQLCGALEAITVNNSTRLSFGIVNEYEHVAKLPSLKKVIVHTHGELRKLRGELLTNLVNLKSKQLEHFETNGQNCVDPAMITQISQLSALRTLIVPYNEAIGDREMESLCALVELEEINLKSCANVSESALLRLIIACPKLQVLHLQGCPNLTDKLLTDIVFKLRLQKRQDNTQRPLPIKLNLYSSNISQICLQHPELAAKDIVDARIIPPSVPSLCYFDMSELLIFDEEAGERYSDFDDEEFMWLNDEEASFSDEAEHDYGYDDDDSDNMAFWY